MLYNGSNGAALWRADRSVGNAGRSRQRLRLRLDRSSPGLQNGSPDGFALVDGFGRVVQFLSYEGTITAMGGAAAGMTSTDIVRFEQQATPGTSLQLAGTGSSYADFTWTFGNDNTSGGTNAGQTFLSGSDQGQIRLDNGTAHRGQFAAKRMLTFTVHRAGGFDTAATVDYTVSFGTADAADLGAGAAADRHA